ncbi:MAG: hypothetical protein KDA96_08455, partial [Planctomycetaceae bacterium]|nr:hypothetical protein [Planctomycetaceae bacterium]
VLLLEPTLTHEEEHQEDRTVAVLLDASASMTLPARLVSDRSRTREQIARELLTGTAETSNGLLQELVRDYEVRFYEFGASARERLLDPTLPEIRGTVGETARTSSVWAEQTRMVDALRQVRSDVPLEKLSGVILLTDGRDHSETNPEQECSSLADRHIPVNSIVIGSRDSLRDAAVAHVQAPSQIYHGDSVSIRAAIRADQYSGDTAVVRLFDAETLIEEQTISIAGDCFQQTVTFLHQPEDAGLHEYRVELGELPGEETTENNSMRRPIWVSQDHIRVLLVDERPRWEFRYLRNLFAGRDRTVFLQSVLLKSDRLAGVPDPPVMHASAQRAFDDCDAHALPRNEAEWSKFDLIILGDVAPRQLGADGLRILERFVKDRGGSLVVIAGQNHMPHAYRGTPLADVLPVRMHPPGFTTAHSPDQSFSFMPTQEGAAQSTLLLWGDATRNPPPSFSQLTWRHPDCEPKAGASVLAVATRTPTQPHATEPAPLEQRRDALMLWHRFGAGKVLQLNFDETWRLRYGIGDRLHHEFWGRIIRWSVNERLSAGTDRVRMGTDRTMYQTGDTLVVQARLLDQERNPVIDEPVQAVVRQGDEVVRTVELSPHPDSEGLLQGEIPELKTPGKYRVELTGAVVDRLLAEETQSIKTVGVDVGVEAASLGHEAMDLVADDLIPLQLADRTGGIVTDQDDPQSALTGLGPKSKWTRERWTVPLWNLWPVIGVFLSGLSLEWVFRRWTGRV